MVSTLIFPNSQGVPIHKGDGLGLRTKPKFQRCVSLSIWLASKLNRKAVTIGMKEEMKIPNVSQLERQTKKSYEQGCQRGKTLTDLAICM